MLGYHAQRGAIAPRPGLHIHVLGPHGDLYDENHYFREAYALAAGSWVLVRPDGHVGAIASTTETLENYLLKVGLIPAARP